MDGSSQVGWVGFERLIRWIKEKVEEKKARNLAAA